MALSSLNGCLFGLRGVYTTAIMVWSFLSQVLRDDKYDHLNIAEPSRRAKPIKIITTFIDADGYTKDIAAPYGFRWNTELDIRSIKSDRKRGHLPCKSPEVVHCEV